MNKADQVIQQFMLGKDPKEVAKITGFSNHQLMAQYMKEKGYTWSSEEKSYQKNATLPPEPISLDTPAQSLQSFGNAELESLLHLLLENKAKLITLLDSSNKSHTQIPRYTIAGGKSAKSLHIPILLEELVKDFAAHKNITQKDLIIAALIDFFNKYGYEQEVRYMLNQ